MAVFNKVRFAGPYDGDLDWMERVHEMELPIMFCDEDETEEEEPCVRYGVFEVFPDGKKYLLHDSTSRLDCEVFVFNHGDATTALRTRSAYLEIAEI